MAEKDMDLMETPKRTRSASINSELRRDIVHGRLRPGTRLRTDDLKRTYGVGLSPLREALMKLTGDGLLILEERKGFRVAPVSRARLVDITNTRKEIEAIAVKMAIVNGNDQWESGILASLHELRKQNKIGPDGLVDDEWERRHKKFHDSIIIACDSEWLMRFHSQLYEQADRYRRLAVHYLRTPRNDVSEHDEIANAVLARDAESSVFLVRRHLERTAQILLSVGELFD